MKKPLRLYNYGIITSLLLMAASTLFAKGEPDMEKRKTYSKSYPVSSTDKISINNQFGEVKIVTWDKQEAQADITIIGKATTNEKAQEIIDNISIEDGKTANGVFFKTNIKDHKSNNNHHGENSGMEINYELHIPAANPLELKNSFGKTFVPDISGPSEISSKFGELQAGNLSNSKKLDVEFGEASIQSANNADISVKFSRAVINKVSGSIKVLVSYGGLKIGIDNSVSSLTVKDEFSELLLDVSKDLSASYDVYANFAELNNETDFKIKEQEEDHNGVKFDHQYNGKSGEGKIPIKVKSNFGGVTLGHNLAFDVNEDKEDADKPEKREKKERKERKERKEKVEKEEKEAIEL
jgi:hypothetical protein